MNLSTTNLCLAASAAIDLHLHTVYSDGVWQPGQLLDHLLHEQFDLAAITDHDRTNALVSIQQLALEKKLPVLVGVEMTTIWKKDELTDLLCFGFDPEHNALNALAEDVMRRQCANSQEVFENLARKGYTFPDAPGALATILATPSPQQPHEIVALLKKHGYGLEQPSAGRIAMEAGLEFATSQPAAVVEAAHQSGAVCILAHPGQGNGFTTFDAPLLDQFRQEAPVDGLEVYHPSHSPEKEAMYRDYAERHHLLISAGSDSHKPEKPPIKYRAEACRQLLEQLGIKIGS